MLHIEYTSLSMKAIMRISFFVIFAIVIFGLTACESNNANEKNTYTVIF